jgi:hypothetical protein
VYDELKRAVARVSRPIRAIHRGRSGVIVQLASGDVEILRRDGDRYRSVQRIDGVPAYDAAFDDAVAVDGTVLVLDDTVVPEPPDDADDGVDRDCDGRD